MSKQDLKLEERLWRQWETSLLMYKYVQSLECIFSYWIKMDRARTELYMFYN